MFRFPRAMLSAIILALVPPIQALAVEKPPAGAAAPSVQPGEMVAKAWALTLAEAAELAAEVLRYRVADHQHDQVRQVVRFTHVTPEGAFMLGLVEPRLLRASFGRQGGVTFHVEMLGAGGAGEAARDALAAELDAALQQEAARRHVPVVSVIWPEVLSDRAEIVEAERTVPRRADVFEKFIRRRPPDPVEGVWRRHDGQMLVGIYRNLEAPGRIYHAMVLEAPKNGAWRAGEIKFEMELLEEDLASGPLFRDDRARADIVWRVERENLVALNGPEGAVRYVRLGPRIDFDREPLHNGTGWVATAEGHVVTNFHVIKDAAEIRVGFREGPWRPARVIIADERMDLAVLEVENPDILGPPLPLAAGPAYPDGAEVTVLGYPLARRLGEKMKVTTGVVNGQNGDKGDPTRLQHSAATQPGSSGGPVVDRHGNVVAVSVSHLKGGDVEQVNFAIKIGYLRLLLEGFGITPLHAAETPARAPDVIAADLRGSVLPVWTTRDD